MKQTTKMLNLILSLLSFHTYSGNEVIMHPFIINELQRLGFKVSTDDANNIYAIRGKAEQYPLINAHMDIVYDIATSIEQKVIAPKQYSYTKDLTYINEFKRLCRYCENIYDCASLATNTESHNWQQCYDDLYDDKYTANDCTSYIYDQYWNLYSKSYATDSSVTTESDTAPYDDDYNDVVWYNNSYIGRYNYAYESYYNKEERAQIDKILDQEFIISYDQKTGRIESNKLRILGGDDKCGIGIALQVARELPKIPMKILFTTQEESGCIGVEHFCKNNTKWLSDVKYSLTIDRRDNDNLVWYACGRPNCSPQFTAQVAGLGIKNHIMVKTVDGTVADVIELRNYIDNCINMSAGYHNPHSLSEYVDFWGTWQIKNWVKSILLEI